MKEIFTMVKLTVSTRDMAKKKAKERGMTLYGYINFLVQKDK